LKKLPRRSAVRVRIHQSNRRSDAVRRRNGSSLRRARICLSSSDSIAWPTYSFQSRGRGTGHDDSRIGQCGDALDHRQSAGLVVNPAAQELRST
jgi:hypothetical protein